MDAAKQREIARKGGRAAHARGTAHEFSVNEARAAGRKGGESVSANRDHMSRIGRIGGKNSAGRRATGRGEAKEGQPLLPDVAAAVDPSTRSPEGDVEAANETKRSPDLEGRSSNASTGSKGQGELGESSGTAAA